MLTLHVITTIHLLKLFLFMFIFTSSGKVVQSYCDVANINTGRVISIEFNNSENNICKE